VDPGSDRQNRAQSYHTLASKSGNPDFSSHFFPSITVNAKSGHVISQRKQATQFPRDKTLGMEYPARLRLSPLPKTFRGQTSIQRLQPLQN
jgi:hypothetical protein